LINPKQKILVICGPTATGKTGFAIRAAKEFNGELISADSRQVYIGMDIGTGKDHPKEMKINLIDVVKPDEDFNVFLYHLMVLKKIKEISKNKKLPILVGGTGFYIKAILDGIETLKIPPNEKVREGMKNWTKKELFDYLQEIDPVKATSLNRSDKNNPRRLIRAIEIELFKKENPSWKEAKNKGFDVLMIGLKSDFKNLYKRVDKRVLERIKKGSEKEVRNLLKKGYDWNLPSLNSMGYIQWKDYFNGKISKDLLIKKWQYDEHNYARRQMIWFKKDRRINWFDINSEKWQDKATRKVKNFLNGKTNS
jgi:tRNA dimethylallyltransferase